MLRRQLLASPILLAGARSSRGEAVTLSQRFFNRFLMKSENGYSVNWSTAYDHIAVYDRRGAIAQSFYPAQNGLALSRINDVTVLPDGGFVASATVVDNLAGPLNALVHVSESGQVRRVVRIHPGYARLVTRASDGRFWIAGRAPSDGRALAVFSSEGALAFSTVSDSDIPVPLSRLQIGATFLAPGVNRMLWVMPEHQIAIMLDNAGSVASRIPLANALGDGKSSGAWLSGEKLLLGIQRPEDAVAAGATVSAVVEYDLAQGTRRVVSMPAGHPVGVFEGSVVCYAKPSGTLHFARLGEGAAV